MKHATASFFVYKLLLFFMYSCSLFGAESSNQLYKQIYVANSIRPIEHASGSQQGFAWITGEPHINYLSHTNTTKSRIHHMGIKEYENPVTFFITFNNIILGARTNNKLFKLDLETNNETITPYLLHGSCTSIVCSDTDPATFFTVHDQPSNAIVGWDRSTMHPLGGIRPDLCVNESLASVVHSNKNTLIASRISDSDPELLLFDIRNLSDKATSLSLKNNAQHMVPVSHTAVAFTDDTKGRIYIWNFQHNTLHLVTEYDPHLSISSILCTACHNEKFLCVSFKDSSTIDFYPLTYSSEKPLSIRVDYNSGKNLIPMRGISNRFYSTGKVAIHAWKPTRKKIY